MYIAVCDDRLEELERVEGLLRAWSAMRDPSLRWRFFRSAGELLEAAEKESFTLYLLDVMMPGTSGLDAARELRAANDSSDIVFLTSSPGFAYESYAVHALDYLLKPLREEVFFPLLDRVHFREQSQEEGITLKSSSSIIRLPFSRIAYVEVNGKHLYFNLSDGSVREIYGTLSEYEPYLLSRPEFMHIHRSYIVNMLQVEEFSSAGVITFSGKNLPVSRKLYPGLQKQYMKLLFSRGGGEDA